MLTNEEIPDRWNLPQCTSFLLLLALFQMTVFLTPLETGKPFPITKSVLLIGRHPDCDLVLKNSPKVSRKHCCVVVVNDQLFVRDLGSMNGIRVNGNKVKESAPLIIGDTLAVGNIEFQITRHPDISNPTLAEPKPNAKQVVSDTPRSIDLSTDFPVILPEEEGVDFLVESDSDEDVTPGNVEHDIRSEPVKQQKPPIIDIDSEVLLQPESSDEAIPLLPDHAGLKPDSPVDSEVIPLKPLDDSEEVPTG